MATWKEGKTYSTPNGKIHCFRRWFDGSLEMVEIGRPGAERAAIIHGIETETKAWIRTARAAKIEPIDETLGGVFRADLCRHEAGQDGRLERVVANAGPFLDRVCCGLCGLALDATAEEVAMTGAAAERRTDPSWYYDPQSASTETTT